MRFRQLNETGIANFADQADSTLTQVGDFARTAYNKFKTSRERAKDKLKSESESDESINDRLLDAKDELHSAELANKTRSTPNTVRNVEKIKKTINDLETELSLPHDKREAFVKSTRRADSRTASSFNKQSNADQITGEASLSSLAPLVLDRVPSKPSTLPELRNLESAQFHDVQIAVQKMENRLVKFTKSLSTALSSASFIGAQERKEVPDRLGDNQSSSVMKTSETMLMQNKFGEHEAWTLALMNDDPASGVKALIKLVAKISEVNSKYNLANQTQTKDRTTRPDGLQLINMLGAQLQIIEARIGMLKSTMDTMEGAPITTEQLKRVRKLAQRL